MNGAETRAERIDPAPKAAGWGMIMAWPSRMEYAEAAYRVVNRGISRGGFDGIFLDCPARIS